MRAMRKIEVVAYDPKWHEEFEKAKVFYEELLETLEVQIEHVGSTSIVGLFAKPILDIDIIVKDDLTKTEVIKRLESVGYNHLGTMGVDGREAFSYSENNQNITWMSHHLYVCMSGNIHLKNHLLLKKHLSNNKDSVRKYSQLKLELAKKFPNDIDRYIDGKTDLINSFLKKEGMTLESLEAIEKINKNQ
jgi:GrpB-like predicted nucleotidyltransferase (UPF0157 family)